ncbi:MAG: CCA tRNA nucleotidyltransferase [Lachnospiraceae bacterium]|nr:CCA tRNA nucleotidyltransferase [Lachnospiraceae bacterium]
MENLKIEIPSGASTIIETLGAHGHVAYVVGGCVRDSVLGRNPADWDITTDALPEEVKEIFPVTIDTGIEHGTVTVRIDHVSYEVTTYRIDGEYEDGRHPKDVTFTRSLEEDLKRRDFTINAMAYNDTEGLVDLFDGLGDLRRGIVRCVGNPTERFSEDALRMLRALRFSAQLDFAIEAETFGAIQTLAPTLSKVSAERIQVELLKLICSDHPERLEAVAESGLSAIFFPEWDAMLSCSQATVHHCYDVGHHTIEVMREVPATKGMRLAALLHDVAKPISKKTDKKGHDHFVGHPSLGAVMARDILRRWKLDNGTIDMVCRLVKYHDERPQLTPRNIRRLVHRIGTEHMEDLLTLQWADILGQSDYLREEKLERVTQLREGYETILREQQCVQISDLKLNGKDVIAAGVPKGPMVGQALEALLQVVLEDPARNEREDLMGELEQWKKSCK